VGFAVTHDVLHLQEQRNVVKFTGNLVAFRNFTEDSLLSV